MAKKKWSGPHRWYEVRCPNPHCNKRHDLRVFDYHINSNPTVVCEDADGSGCGQSFEVTRVEDVKLIWTRPV